MPKACIQKNQQHPPTWAHEVLFVFLSTRKGQCDISTFLLYSIIVMKFLFLLDSRQLSIILIILEISKIV
jgi:hypothetical protein